MIDTHAPRLLDLFCCEGGAGKGYADAGFEVVGVDLESTTGTSPTLHGPGDDQET